MWKHRGPRLWLLLAIAALVAGSAVFIACTQDEQGKKAGAAGKGLNKRPGGDEEPVANNGNNGNGQTAKPSGSKYVGEDTVANAGSLKGTVTYKGAKKAGTLNIAIDPTVCKHNGESDDTVIASGDGKLKNAIVYIVGISKGKKWEADKVEVDNHECLFHPRIQLLPTGGTVVAKNSDPVLHNTQLTLKLNGTGKMLANKALPKQGQTVEVKMKKSAVGVVSVTCDVHKWMQAYVFISDSPYAAVTGDDGAFEIDDVPPGDYVAKVWHETLGEKETKVKVDSGGAATLDIAFD